MNGRQKLYTEYPFVDTFNLIEVLQKVFPDHERNANDIRELIAFEKNEQEQIRVKTFRPDIDNFVPDPIANFITDFKCGFEWGNPITFVQSDDDDVEDNEMLTKAIALGVLIFVDDYFNCLTVGSVMKPVTSAKKVSSAKLAYLIDATAAPICIIAPISSWAAAVAGFAAGAGAESGFSLFINAIPYNFYAILTIVMMLFLAITGFDFGPMKKHEASALGGNDLAALENATDALRQNDRGRVYDLVIPVVVLVAACVVGMIYSGGYFGEDNPGFIQAFSDSDASVGLVYGSIFAIVFAVAFYLCRRVISFKDCMDAFPEGFKAMVPAIMILCCAWTLKAMTDSLGAKVFISDLINGAAVGLKFFLPAIIFLVACFLAFASGTSWGTFGKQKLKVKLRQFSNSE